MDYLKALCQSVGMFTVIPVPFSKWEGGSVRHIMLFFPLCGAIIGAMWAAVFWASNILSLPVAVGAAAAASAPFILTGFLHLDGFMDVCDALLSRREREDKLRILKDPHIGSFAACSLAVLFLFQWGAAYTVLMDRSEVLILIFIPIFSRILASLAVFSFPIIGQSTLAASFKGQAGRVDTTAVVLMLAALLAGTWVGMWYSPFVWLAMTAVFAFCVLRCKKAFGGISGDVMGFAITMSEAAALLVFCLIR